MCMKYVITETQYRSLLESNVFDKLKRRVNKKYFSEFIEEAVDEFFTCDEFDDAYEYADGVMRRAISNFLYGLVGEVQFTHESFEESEKALYEICWDWFADELAESFYNECSEGEDEEDSISLRDLRDFD